MQEFILRFFKEISSPFLDVLVEGCTILGEQIIFILIIALLYWSVSKKHAVILACALLFSAVTNSLLKMAFRMPRPFEKLDFITGKRLETATGYSFPSGHTQSAATFYFSAAAIIRKPWAWISASFIIVIVAVSRVYLGVHWPVDVMASIILGLCFTLLISLKLEFMWYDTEKRDAFIYKLGLFVLFSLIIMTGLELLIFNGSLKVDDFFKSAGVFLGGMGGFLLDSRYLRFSAAKGSFLKKMIRFTIGLIFTFIILNGIKMILPQHFISHIFRYGLLGLWLTFLYPLLGMKTGLFEKE